MAIGSLGYVVNDGLIRRATESGLDVYQALCLRSIGLTVVFAAVGRIQGEQTVRAHLTRPLLLRVGAEMLGSALFFAGVVRMEFANAQAILQVVPFAVTLAAALILKERVSGRQYLTVVLGFVGVLILVRPATDAFSAWSLVVLASAGFIVIREFATRRISSGVPATSIAMVTAAGLAMLTGAISMVTGWGAITVESVVMIVLAMASLFIGYLFAIQTVRVGDLSVSAPFRYTLLVGAVIIGYLMFDEVPDALTILGGVIIVLSGLYAVQLERRRQPLTA